MNLIYLFFFIFFYVREKEQEGEKENPRVISKIQGVLSVEIRRAKS